MSRAQCSYCRTGNPALTEAVNDVKSTGLSGNDQENYPTRLDACCRSGWLNQEAFPWMVSKYNDKRLAPDARE